MARYDFNNLISRKATSADLPDIIRLLHDDELGKIREHSGKGDLPSSYQNAFEKIDLDPNQYLMVVEEKKSSSPKLIISTCHLTLMPSLTLQGALRLSVEAVRVASTHRGCGIGAWMFEQVFKFAKTHDVSMIQLATDKKRIRAKKFYEQLGFIATHEGMKFQFIPSHRLNS